MNPAIRLLTRYARYHRDPRNIATHLIGIPLIALSLVVLLARARIGWGELSVSADVLVWLGATAWYLTLGQRGLTLITAAVLGALVLLAHPFGTAPFETWLGFGLGSFVVGWIIQFVGHHWEGRKPAFVDDIRSLLVGPMFVVAEVGFALGGWSAIKTLIETEAGPVRRRTATQGHGA